MIIKYRSIYKKNVSQEFSKKLQLAKVGLISQAKFSEFGKKINLVETCSISHNECQGCSKRLQEKNPIALSEEGQLSG